MSVTYVGACDGSLILQWAYIFDPGGLNLSLEVDWFNFKSESFGFDIASRTQSC